MTDLYQILQIKPNASEQEIKKAYYNLSKKYHPDKCSEPNSCQRFQEINSAYNILIDEKWPHPKKADNASNLLKSYNQVCIFISLLLFLVPGRCHEP
jgi:hypothetical protein